MESLNMYSLYWIRYNHHTDPFTEGYIGITNDIDRRWKEHSNRSRSITKRAIDKGATIEVLFNNLTEELVYFTERFFRPNKQIGWNIAEGGIKAPDQTGFKHSEETKRQMSEERKGNKNSLGFKHTEATRKKQSDSRKGMTLHPNTSAAISQTNRIKNQEVVECYHCGKVGKAGGMNRWHFDNCKLKGVL